VVVFLSHNDQSALLTYVPVVTLRQLWLHQDNCGYT